MKKYTFLFILPLVLLLIKCSSLGFGEFKGKVTKVEGTAHEKANVIFTYKDAEASSVSLAGDFNDWNTEATPMEKDGDTWKASLDLQPGKYQYKFVINGAEWKIDPNNPKTVEDRYGGKILLS